MPQIGPVLLALGQNISLLLALLFLYRLVHTRVLPAGTQLPPVLLGLLFGGIALVGMLIPIQILPGVMIDGRVIMAALAGLFGGPVAAVSAAGPIALYRLSIGGAGMVSGIGAILTGAALGAIVWHRWGEPGRLFGPRAFGLFGFVVGGVGLLWTLLLPSDMVWPALQRLGLPVLIVYPPAAILFGMLFAQEQRRQTAEAAQRASEARYRTLVEHFPNGTVLLFDHELRYTLAGGAGLGEVGLSRALLEGKTVAEVFPPATRHPIEQAYRAALAGTSMTTEVPFQGHIYRMYTLPLTDAHGRITAGMAMTQDITADTRAAAALKESEERYARLAEAAFEGIMFSEAGIIRELNGRLAGMLGYQREELIGRPIDEIVAPESRNLARRRIKTAYHGRYELLALHKNGTIFPVEVQARSAQYQGRPIRVTAVRDIRERLAVKQALARSEQMFKDLVQSINAVVWEADAQTFRFAFVSEPAEKLLGYPAADWLASPTFWSDHIHPDDRDAAVDYCMSCTRALEHHEFEYRMIAADGRIIWLRDLVAVEALDGKPHRLRGVMVDITPRKQAEAALSDSEARFRAIFEQAAVGIALIGMDRRPITSNQALEAMLGYTADELRAMTFTDVTHPDDAAADLRLFGELIDGARDSYQIEKRYIRKDQEVVWGRLTVSLVRSAEGAPRFAIGMVEDNTERKLIEAQYFQAQKLEAIGRLAGGIAHDFNNLLTVILGSGELLREELDQEHPLACDVAAILDAGRRGAALTRQLLAFSRRQVLQPDIVNLNTIVPSIEQLLRRLIGEDIVLITKRAENLGTVQVDPNQIEQVLLNLAVNARDAMPNGGTLIIETANVMLDAGYAHQHGDVIPGPYSMVAMSDTGCGMDTATLARIYEPFFTTKGPGKGTGLGLPTVYGIVQQSGGYIWVYSEVGRGTTFKIYLPQVAAPPANGTSLPGTEPAEPAPAIGSATILLLEDEPLVRDLASRVLRARGYQVLECGDSSAALQLAAEYPRRIDVLLSDIVVPGGMSGPQVAEQVRVRQPELRVLYMSGYTDTAITYHAAIEPGHGLLQKPFTPEALAQAVWQVLHVHDEDATEVSVGDNCIQN